MTFVGRVLVVVQVLLSLCFMAFAGAVYTTQQSWREQMLAVDERLKQRNVEYADMESTLSDERDHLKAQLTDTENKFQEASALATNLQRTLDLRSTELDATISQRNSARELTVIAQEEATIRQQEAVTLRAVNTGLHGTVDSLLVANRHLRDNVFTLGVERSQLVKRHDGLLEDYRTLRLVLLENKIEADPKLVRARKAPPPVVQGEVLETSKESPTGTELVEISVGSDDGLITGHELDIYRLGIDENSKPEYLGRIELVYVDPDRAVGTVIQRSKNGIIQRGDNVTTKL